MKKDKFCRLLMILGIILIIIYVIVMIYETNNFSPYNTGWFLWSDRALEFLLPAIICFVIRAFFKNKI